MTTIAPPATLPTSLAGPITLRRVITSEWTKFRSLRSTWWSLAATVVISLGLGLASSVDAANGSPGEPARDLSAHDIAVASQFGLLIAQLAALTLGALFVTGEYGTGMIRATMTAVPRRSTVLLAKASVLVAVIFPVMAFTSVTSLLLGNVAFRNAGLDTASFGDGGVLSVVLGTPLYLSAAAVFALSVGTVLRNSAATVSALTAGFFIVPIIVALSSAFAPMSPFLPPNAGGAMAGQTVAGNPLDGGIGFALFCAYTVLLGLVAAVRLHRSDS